MVSILIHRANANPALLLTLSASTASPMTTALAASPQSMPFTVSAIHVRYLTSIVKNVHLRIIVARKQIRLEGNMQRNSEYLFLKYEFRPLLPKDSIRSL